MARNFNETVLVGRDLVIGCDSVVGNFSCIGNDVVIGNNVFIGPHCTIGDNVQIESNVVILDGVTIEPNTVIASNCVIGNHTVISSGVTVGMETFIGDHCVIGNRVGICIKNASRMDVVYCEIGNSVNIYPLCVIDGGVTKGKQTVIGGNTVLAEACKVNAGAKIGKNCCLLQMCLVGDNAIIHDNVNLTAQTIVGERTDLGEGLSGVNRCIFENQKKYKAGMGYFRSPCFEYDQEKRVRAALKNFTADGYCSNTDSKKKVKGCKKCQS